MTDGMRSFLQAIDADPNYWYELNHQYGNRSVLGVTKNRLKAQSGSGRMMRAYAYAKRFGYIELILGDGKKGQYRLTELGRQKLEGAE